MKNIECLDKLNEQKTIIINEKTITKLELQLPVNSS